MTNKEWFKDAGFGMMAHWGLYSLIGGEWKGKRMGGIGEWAQSYFEIPIAEYEQLAKVFNPIYFNADEWISLAKECGMKYFVITSKHHDGFCLFHTKVDKWNIVDSTPFGRDVIAELAEACYKHGLKFGVYYSQEIDWHEPNGGGWTRGRTWCGAGQPNSSWWVNNWDFPNNEEKDYSQCFNDKIKPQVTELLKNYGDLCLIWFDTPHTISEEQSTELYNLVKSIQPNCLVNSRIGNGLGDYRSTGDNQINFTKEDHKKVLGNGTGAHAKIHLMQTDLFECPATLNDTWGYKTFDQNWKSAERLREIRARLNERGINYLLNVGPDYLGRIPAPSVDILREMAQQDSEEK